MQALQTAVAAAGKSNIKQCIHHSDRGIQYSCPAYVKVLLDYDIKSSMTENSDPRENAIAERVNGIIKDEFSDEKEISFKDFNTAQKQIVLFIDFYNNQRPHSSIGRVTPATAYTMEGELKKLWKNYRKNKTGTKQALEAEAKRDL